MASKTKAMCVTAMFSVLLMLGAWIAVPSVPPFTLQTLVLFCMVCLLDGKTMFGAVAVYIALGAVGLPVFAGFQGGVGVFVSATGGYLVGFLLMAGLRWLWPSHRFRHSLIVMSIGILLSYFCAVVWYAALFTGLTAHGFWAAMLTCVVPFVLPDAAKAVAAVWLSRRLSRFMK